MLQTPLRNIVNFSQNVKRDFTISLCHSTDEWEPHNTVQLLFVLVWSQSIELVLVKLHGISSSNFRFNKDHSWIQSIWDLTKPCIFHYKLHQIVSIIFIIKPFSSNNVTSLKPLISKKLYFNIFNTLTIDSFFIEIIYIFLESFFFL